jgi:hypothetical protein
MSRKYFRFYFAAFLSLLVEIVGAQTHLLVQLTSGSTESYPLSDVRSIRFGSENMIINRINAAQINFNIANVVQYSFGDQTPVNASLSDTGAKLALFPNPASDFVDVVYTNTKPESVRIELFDATGRPVYEIFKGIHDGKQAIRQTIGLQPGLYFCRLSSDGKMLTKSLMIQ